MEIEQALYGEYRGGHSLLAASTDDDVSTGIVQRLDLPDTAPPHVEWSPFLRGFPYRDRYVLARTFRDTRASRGGMVLSHALLAGLDEIVETTNLRPLLMLLATSDLQRPDVRTVRIVRAEAKPSHASELMAAAEAFATTTRLPVVRLGHVGFDDLVVALWEHLLPEIRRGFAFRLSFDPRDLVDTPVPALVCTPHSMVARWTDHPVVGSVASTEPASLVAAILSGHEAAAPLLDFMQGIGSKPATIGDLWLLEQAYLLNIGEPMLERRIAAARLIERLSPDSNSGEDTKNVLVRRLCELVPVARAEEIMLLRNLQFLGFPSPSRIWSALKTWAAKCSYPEDQDVDTLSVLEDATTRTAAVQEWRTAVLEGLAIATRSRKSSFSRAFWRWFQMRPETMVALFHHVPTEAGVEERLANATPRSLNEATSRSLLTRALSRRWFRLHGALLSASCSPSNAARRQIAVDTDPAFDDGLRSALRHAKPAELVAYAREVDDPRMLRLAGEAVAKDPGLLPEADLRTMKTQAIWREALTIDPKCWQRQRDPVAAFHSVLDCLLDRGAADPLLIERLSHTPVADLLTYARRPSVWSRVGGIASNNLLSATAKGWLRQAAGLRVPFVPEDALQTAILSTDEIERTLDALLANRPGNAIPIVAALARYDERRFLRLIGKAISRSTALPTFDAEVMGRLVLERRWKRAAAALVAQYRSGLVDLKPALRACYDIFGFWERFTLALTPVSESEKWEGFQELASELYPGGPDDLGLWERAGGNDADLPTTGDGRMRWRKTLRDIRNGKGPTPSALLAKMKEDFPNNERIRPLVGDRGFAEGARSD